MSSAAPPNQDAPRAASAPPAGDEDWIHLDFSQFPLEHHLLHGSLAGEDRMEEYALYHAPDRSRVRARVRLGPKICGHPRVVHGGAIASIIDDTLGTLFLMNGMNGYTANLSVNYRRPIPAGTTVFVDAVLQRIEPSSGGVSHKVAMAARVVDALDAARLYAEGTALFVTKEVPTSAAMAAKMAASRAASPPSVCVDGKAPEAGRAAAEGGATPA